MADGIKPKKFFMKSRNLVLICLILAACISTHAQDKTADIDKIFNWSTPNSPGCVCAVSQNGNLVVNKAYGQADLERDAAITPNSVFDAGSLRKQFVAAAILMLVEEGKITLDDDVRKHIPELPDYGHKITINHLLTHTSGLRDWPTLLPLSGGNADVLTLILRQRGLNFIPGEEWSYSNSGYVLATEIVARKSGMSFAEFTNKRILEPLGMKSTRYVSNMKEVVKNRALAYQKSGASWRMDMLLENDRGGGGALLATASDLLTWNDALTNGRLGAFVTQKLQEPAKLNNGRELKYARGLTVDSTRGGRVVWHSGGAAGYHSWLGRLTDQGLSIAVLCNSDAMAASNIARRVADLFLAPGATENKPPATDAGITVVDPDSKAGLFFNERNGDAMRLIVNNGRLGIAGGGSPLVPIDADKFRAARADLFFMSQDLFEIHFISKDQFELRSMEGQATRYRRATPYAPAAAALQSFAGLYTSDDLGVVYQVLPGKTGLIMRLELSPDKAVEFVPVDQDAFQLGRAVIRFRRDKAGKVIGLAYSNPLVRNIPFRRLDGRN
jgi:CubicO group peptidase (beta-lactamase class C family)